MGNLLLPFTIGYHLKNETEDTNEANNQQEFNLEEASHFSTADRLQEASTSVNSETGPLVPADGKEWTFRARLKKLFQHILPQRWSETCKKKPKGTPHLTQDGYISSFMYSIVWISASFSISLARWISDPQRNGVSPQSAQCNLLINMSIACCIMWAFCLYQYEHLGFMKKYVLDKKKTSGLRSVLASMGTAEAEGMQGKPTSGGGAGSRIPSTNLEVGQELGQLVVKYIRDGIQNAIPLIGILIFFFLGMFLDIMSVVAHAECMPVYRSLGCEDKYIIGICTHVMRIVFQGTVLVFTFKFHNKSFKQCTVVRYLLLTIVGAMATMWFDTLLYESREIFQDKVQNQWCHNVSEIFQQNTSAGLHYQTLSSAKETSTAKCVNKTTDLYITNAKLSPYFYPMHIEFALMVCEIMFHLYFNVRDEDPPPTGTNNKKESTMPCIGPDDVNSDTDPLLANSKCTSGYGTLSDDSLVSLRRPKSTQERSKSQPANGDLSPILEDVVREPPPTLDEIQVCGREENAMDLEESHAMSFPATAITETNEMTDQVVFSPTGNVRRRNTHNPAVCTTDTDQIDILPDNASATCVPKTAQSDKCKGESRGQTRSGKITGKGKALRKCRAKPKKGLPQVFAPFMILNIVVITLGGLTYLDNRDPPPQNSELRLANSDNCTNSTDMKYNWRQTYEIFQLIQFSILVITIIIGFNACRHGLPRFKPYHGLDMLIMIVTFGFYLHSFLTIIAELSYILDGKNTSECPLIVPALYPYLSVLGNIVSLFEVYLQTTLYMHAGRTKFPECRARARTTLKNCLAALAMSNLSCWIVDSFVEVKNPHLEPLAVFFYDPHQWHMISDIFFPLTLFYRLNSSLLLLSVFLEH